MPLYPPIWMAMRNSSSLPNEDVYVKGEGFPPCRDVTIYVIPDGLDPTPGNAVADSTGVTDIGGDLPVTLVWSGPLVMGEYDIWVDVNQNGEHDDCDIYVAKALECYMFFVIPEFPMGTIASVLATVCGLGVFALKKKRKGILRFQSHVGCLSSIHFPPFFLDTVT